MRLLRVFKEQRNTMQRDISLEVWNDVVGDVLEAEAEERFLQRRLLD